MEKSFMNATNGNIFRNNIDELINENHETMEHKLTYYREMFKNMIQHAPVAMYILEDGIFSYINEHFCKVIGYTESELVSGEVTFDQLIHPEDLPNVYEKMMDRLTGKENDSRYRIRAFKKDGSLLYVEIHPNHTVVNGKAAVMGTVIDVTEEMTTQLQLKENQERFQALFYHNPDAIFIMDLEGKFINVNHGCEVLSGYLRSEILEMTFTPLILSRDLPKAVNYFEQSTKGLTNNYDITIMRKDGVQRHVNITSYPMEINGEIAGAYGIAKDITENVEYRKQIEHLAFYDSLTKLPNRQLFEDQLQQAIELSKEHGCLTAVLFLDVDRFKFINDSLGHHLGDEFLKILSNRLKENLRITDTMARFAGDEFTIMLPNTTEEHVIKLAERLNIAFAEPFNIKGHSVSVSVSIGIAFSNSQEEILAADLVKKADTAMYYSKKYRQNPYTIYTKELELDTTYKLTIEQDLKSAIKNNEFVLHYQPIMDLNTNNLAGMEALIRWNHPQLGLLSPDKFIAIAEESGKIVSIGKWVLRTACIQNKKWQDSGYPPFRIAVNISTIQLQHYNFVEIVETVLEETGLEAKWLELEVTESILMEETEILKGNLIKLKKLGVSISIDDFGAGYTSLSYLRQFSFDRVKIDKSFINDINSDLNGKAITSTIITLAHKLKMGVIAEGIEDEVQLSYLRNEKSNEGQGYYFSRPLPPELHQFPMDLSCWKKEDQTLLGEKS
ncbi:MAG TPA: EAL domain-containing protein [Pseudoneobacillus sp.]|nr:EAL domain-containing protein [Pseudoneobacillus sp.]